jgi:hypothetical protein
MEFDHVAKLVAPDLGYVLREELYSTIIKVGVRFLLLTYLCHSS